MRIFTGFLCLAPFVLPKFRKIKKHHWKFFLISGLTGNAIPAFLFTRAETGISSSLAGILNALTPMFTMLLSIVAFKTKLTSRQALGVFIGFAGTAMLFGFSGNTNISGEAPYAIMVILATVCYAVSINVIRSHLHDTDPLLISGYALVTVGPFCGIYLFSTDVMSRVTDKADVVNLVYVLILGIMGTAISLIYFNRLIKMTNAVFASSTTYFIPFVAVLWGLFDHEQLGWEHIISLLTILVGVYFINKNTSEKKFSGTMPDERPHEIIGK